MLATTRPLCPNKCTGVREAMTSVRLGQLWEVYSIGEGRWCPSTVTDIDDNYVTLRSQDRQWHRCHVADMEESERYRLISDLIEVR